MEFFTADPSLSLKETYLRAHSLTIRTDLDYDYATNANFYFYIYKFFLGFFSYTPGVGRIITASSGSGGAQPLNLLKIATGPAYPSAGRPLTEDERIFVQENMAKHNATANGS